MAPELTEKTLLKRRLVFLIGASGVGKTAVAKVLQEREPWTGNTFFFDRIGVPTQDEMEKEFGGGEGWQRKATEKWIGRLSGRDEPLRLLEGQTRPSFILPAVELVPEVDPIILLLDCSREVRASRLTLLRKQPELLTAQMEHWAEYLRGQAVALGVPIIDTSFRTREEVAIEVEWVVNHPGVPNRSPLSP